MKKFVFILITLPIFLSAQNSYFGIDTDAPESLLDITHNDEQPTEKAGITITPYRQFPDVNPTDNQNGMLINYTGENLNKGLYYWDDKNAAWQYIFQSSTIKNNLAKISFVSTSGFQQIPVGLDTSWKKTNFNIINTPNSNFKINTSGDIVIGETGSYNLYFTGGITQASPANTATSCEIEIVRIDAATSTESVIRTSSLAIPAPDVASRSSNSTISLNTSLTKGDILMVRTRRLTNNTTITTPSTNYAVILSKLSN